MFIGMEGAKRDGVRDTRIGKIVELVPPERLLAELPLGPERAKAVIRGREEVRRVLQGQDPRLMGVVGPCSGHDPKAALGDATRVRATGRALRGGVLGGVGGYFEKARAATRWEGVVKQPPPARSGGGQP